MHFSNSERHRSVRYPVPRFLRGFIRVIPVCVSFRLQVKHLAELLQQSLSPFLKRFPPLSERLQTLVINSPSTLQIGETM